MVPESYRLFLHSLGEKHKQRVVQANLQLNEEASLILTKIMEAFDIALKQKAWIYNRQIIIVRMKTSEAI